MTLRRGTFAIWLVGLVVWPASALVAAALGVIGLSLLVTCGFRRGSWTELRSAFLVPLAALVADVVTFTPLSLQPDTDGTIYTVIALSYLPAWAVLVALGIVARRLTHSPQSTLT